MIMNVAQKMWRELQAALNMIANALLDDLASVLSPQLVISNDSDTASTDGKLWVRLPEEFCGIRLGEKMQIFLGLLVHEIGHWLQPLVEVHEVEKKTSIDHAVVNVLLDIHLEALVIRIFPLFSAPLIAVRELVGGTMKKEYEKGYKEAASFVDAAEAALLFGRFCVHPDKPFVIPYPLIRAKSKRNEKVDLKRMADLLALAVSIPSYLPADLPAFVEQTARDYPELCERHPSGLFLNPLDDLSSGGEGMPLVKGALAKLSLNHIANPTPVVEEKPQGYNPPTSETLALSRMLQRRWETPRLALSIMAPGRLNRLSAVRGDPVPYTIALPHKGRDDCQTRAILVLDRSGSMEGLPWQVALQSAQAITLAIRATGGDVRVALFAEHFWCAPEYTAEALFADSLGAVSLHKADGRDTVFTWLPEVWQAFPGHRVILLTDGNGIKPSVILPSGRRRTSAVLFRVRETYKGSPNTIAEIETTMYAIASCYVHVDTPNELSTAWSLLIPRRPM